MMVRNLLILVFLGLLVFLGIRYWPTLRGLYKANAPVKNGITSLIPETGKEASLGQNNTSLPLKIPDGYSISIFAKNLGNPRDLVLDPKGNVVASITGQGKVVVILNGTAETVAGGLNKPHGLAFNGSKLFVAETDGVSVFDYDTNLYKVFNKKKIIDLPGGGRHFTRSLLIRGDKLYVSTGSSCDTCKEDDGRRASIWVSNLGGSDFRSFATGLRNAVFMALNPDTNEIWATEMGRDNLGDDIPPDEVNVIKEGEFYGWPYCWGDGENDKDLNKDGVSFDCAGSVKPHYKLQAHSAPLGIAFLGQDLLIAYHGSWNRSDPTGYKVVKISNGSTTDFISGWLSSSGNVLGRPVDVLVNSKGDEIFISDDKEGVIYLLRAN